MRPAAIFAFILSYIFASPAAALGLKPHQQTLLEIYREMVEINTVHPHGNNTALAERAASRLRVAGFADKDIELVVPAANKGNLIARIGGSTSAKPMLLLAHIDVVDAQKSDWSEGLDPFKLTEKDGFYYGRGTADDKAMAAIFLDSMIRLKREGFTPKRDIILALTADEEGGTHNGIAHLLKNRRALIDAEFAINEGGGGSIRHGRPFAHHVQVSEKMYLTFDFEAINAGGHSSLPVRDNAIYALAGALDRLSRHDFAAVLNFVTRLGFTRLAAVETGALAIAMEALSQNTASDEQLKLISAEPRYNSLLRTTCVATRLEAGHADNALPQRAKATVNCRLLPREDPDFVRAELQKLAGEKVRVTMRGMVRPSEPTDAQSAVFKTIVRISESMWPGVPVIPVMSAGATDGSRLRNDGIPTYGTSGIFYEFGESRIHGKDERVMVRSFYEGQEYLYRLIKALAME